MSSQRGTLRVAVIDNDSAFLRVLGKRFDAAGWEHRVLAGSVPADELVAMKLNALVVDPALLGPDEGWAFLERISGLLPQLGIIVVSSNADRRPARPRPPARRRRLDREALPPRGGRSRGSRRSSAVIAARSLRRTSARWSSASSRSAPTSFRPSSPVAPSTSPAASSSCSARSPTPPAGCSSASDLYRRVWGYEMAHGDRSVDVFVRKLRSKIQKRSPGWTYIHTHFGIGYRFEPARRARPHRQPASADGCSHRRFRQR